MVVTKMSISFTNELASAARELADGRGEDLSRLIETLLREHPLVIRTIQASREAQSNMLRSTQNRSRASSPNPI